ncbi:S-layer homology domain-containing protein [Paenibacillaceae bacterium WGS1546]|uniref:S-layer homology domain-containing protein n=1 Tax=Cohnella sp. WGS1546 TaxID=3366810 RepID=UPI00372D4CB0
MKKKWLVIALIISLLFGGLVPQAGAEGGQASNPLHFSDNFETVLSNQPAPVTPSPSVTSATYGNGIITVGGIEGYQPINGYAVLSREDGMSLPTTRYLTFNQLDISDVEIDQEAKYSLYLEVHFLDDLSRYEKIVYIDSMKLKGDQLASMNSWPIAQDAVTVTPDLSNLTEFTDTVMFIQPDGLPQLTPIRVTADSFQHPVSIRMKPGKLLYTMFGKQNDTGYGIHKSVDILGETALTVTLEDINSTALLTLPSETEIASVYPGAMLASSVFKEIDKLALSKSTFNISIEIKKSLDEEKYLKYDWHTSQEITQPKSLILSDHIELQNTFLNVIEDRIAYTVAVKSGDFYLGVVSEYTNEQRISAISSNFTIRDNEGEILHESTNPNINWYTGWELLDPKLTPGKYTVELTVNYPGLPTPLTISKEIIFGGPDGRNTNGLSIRAQDDSGKPLSDGQVFLFEKQLPDILDVNLGTNFYFPILKYESEATTPGLFFIPSAYLLAGKDYEVVIIGKSSNGQSGGVLYHQSITSGQSDLNLNSENLKRFAYTAQNAKPGDFLHLTIRSLLGHNLIWPTLVPFNDQHQAVAYVQTEDNLRVYGYQYPSDSVGIYLESEHSASSPVRVDLTADLVRISAPDGYDNSAAMIAGGMPKKTWYVTKGSNIWVDYWVSKNGYRYDFATVLSPIEETKLSFEKNLSGFGQYHTFHSGQLEQDIYQTFYDGRYSTLFKVSRELQTNNEHAPYPSLFQAHTSEGVKNISVENTGESIEYREVEINKEGSNLLLNGSAIGGGGGTREALLEYQLYNYLDQPVGERWLTNFPMPFKWDIPNVAPGDYTLKLVQQNFPEEVVKLSGELNIHLLPALEQSRLRIPVDFPANFDLQDFLFDFVEIRAKNGSALDGRIDQSGHLNVEGLIDPNEDYVILLALILNKSKWTSDSNIYYRQLRLKGSELLGLDRITVPSNLAAVSQSFIRPIRPDDSLRVNYLMPVEGFSQPFVFFSYPYDTVKMMLSPEDFVINLLGNDNSVTGYSRIKKIGVNPDTHALTVSDAKIHEVRLKQEHPFLSFMTSYAEYPSYIGAGYSFYEKRLLNKVHVSEGRQSLSFYTYEALPYENPWLYSWETKGPVNVQGDLTLEFDGRINPNISKLHLVQSKENGITSLELRPELVSGVLRLTSVAYIIDERSYSPSAKVVIKNSANQTVYAGQSLAWNFGMNIRAALDAGTYTLTFSLPIGPNKEISLTESFTVSGDGVSSPPTAPTGLKTTEITANSATLNWNASWSPVGVKGYTIYSGNTRIGSTKGATTYKVTGLTPNTSYTFTVKAFDDNGIESLASQAVSFKTLCVGICGVGGGGGGGGGGGFMPPSPADEHAAIVLPKDIPAAANGKIALNADGKQSVVLPEGIAGIVGDNKLEVRIGGTTVSIPPQVLEQLAKLGVSESLTDSNVVLSVVPLDPADVLATSANPAETGTTPQGAIYELQLFIQSKNGEEKKLTQFDAPITLRFAVNAGADRRLTGIYFIADNGSLEYAGGKWEDNELVAELSHFSKYGVFQVVKQFSDVPEKHWARSVIQEMFAKQVVNGVTESTFAPDKNISRSEFAAMLVKALKLKSTEDAGFSDVPPHAWYAQAVSAAYENGIIKGVSEGRFAPGQLITREEMAVMAVNAVRFAQQSNGSGAKLEFKDAEEISGWARTAVSEVTEIGLMKGRSGNAFSPKTNATRAEAAQVVSNLLKELSQ